MTFQIKHFNNKFVLTVVDDLNTSRVYYFKTMNECSDVISSYINLSVDIENYFRKRRKIDFYDIDFLKTFIKYKYCDLGILFDVNCIDEINYIKHYYFDYSIYFIQTVSKPTGLGIEFNLMEDKICKRN